MYKVITEFNRPSEDIPYYIDTNTVLKSQFLEFISANWGILISNMETVNLGTQQISTSIYPDENAFNTFMSAFNSEFPTFFADRDAYCATNNITVTRSVDTI
jgi:hypothetical protein